MEKSDTTAYWHCLLPEEVKVINLAVNNREAMSDADWKLLGIVAARLEQERTEQDEPDLRAARRLVMDDDCMDEDLEVDEHAVVLRTSDGFWVQAWAYVYDEDVREELQNQAEV